MKITKIGNQNWTTENLTVDKYLNGDPIPFAKTQNEWKEFNKKKEGCYCIFKNDENLKHQGYYYNGYAVIDKRGIAEDGWKIPSAEDFETLIEFSESQKGGFLNLITEKGWDEHFKGTNLYGLNALPTGFASVDMEFKGTGIVLALWTSTKVEKYLCGYNLSTYVDEEEQEISLKSYNYDIRYGRSIRLINTK
ncbi:MAG: fibrobacter succinogenes major paralogous domain-containing protein [Bacteroidota bacterium]|jgi:uncharacterized protein (TIGR02145 family)